MQAEPIPIDELDQFHEFRDSHGKALTILRSSMALVSLFASSILVWMIRRSHIGLSNTYHRLLLGMCFADIIFSLGSAHFNFTSPIDVNYLVWNARGNQMTCSLQGFIFYMGAYSGLIYMCSLNFYYLAVVKYQKSELYIRKKIEPYLHGVPIAFAVITTIIIVAMQNFNVDDRGFCATPIYKPPHCYGYEDFEVREGFNIPCGRGRDGAVIFMYAIGFLTLFIVPIAIVVSLAAIYRSVSQQEKKIARFGFKAANPTTPSTQHSGTSSDDEHKTSDRISSIITSAISTGKRMQFVRTRKTPSYLKRTEKSRAVMHKAFAYSAAYFLTWSFYIVCVVVTFAGVVQPTVRTVLLYLRSIFNPLQGLFNFIIFMFPKVMSKRKRQPEITWCKAFTEAFWSRGIDSRNVGRQPPINHAQQQQKRKEQKPSQDEEEKAEIQPHESPLYSEEVHVNEEDEESRENVQHQRSRHNLWDMESVSNDQ